MSKQGLIDPQENTPASFDDQQIIDDMIEDDVGSFWKTKGQRFPAPDRQQRRPPLAQRAPERLGQFGAGPGDQDGVGS